MNFQVELTFWVAHADWPGATDPAVSFETASFGQLIRSGQGRSEIPRTVFPFQR